MNRTLPLTAFILFLSIQMMAQPISCFNFEGLPANTQLGPASGNSPGDILFSQAGIQVSIQEIQYPDGSTGFWNASILDASTGWLDGQFLLMGNNSLSFDFSQADGALNQLCFDFFDGGGVENFGVNGSAVAVVENFSEIAALNFPGVTVEVTFASDSLLERGTVCVTGNIESLLIGGQEFGIDNVCADAVLACPLANLRAEIVSCDDAGNYNIEVDFDWLSPLTVIASFDILIEGEQAAFISQADLPYLLEGVQPATDALEFTLTVCQNDNPNCCESVILQKQCPTGSCMEFEGLAEASYGSSAGTPAGTEIYSESGIGLRLIPFQSLFWTTTYGDLVVLDETTNPEMTAAAGRYLSFESINAVFDLTGYAGAVDSVVVDFYYNGGAINLAANGSNILIQNSLAPGLYALAPGITMRAVFDAAGGREGQLIFYGNVQSLLIGGEGDFRIDNLCVNPVDEPCELSNMAVEVGPCNDDGTFAATIYFDYQGASDSFILAGPGALGTFAYTDLPITIADAPINNSGIYAYYATDTGPDLCWVGDTLQAVPCTGCAFEGLSVDYLGLADNGLNAISLDFELVGPALTDFFSVYFGGELYGRFSWNDVPIRLLVPCNTNDLVQEITVCEGEDHCCVSLPLSYLQPCANPCSITNVELHPGPCNPNNVFEVKLDFDYQNTSDTFELWLNGNGTGRFFAYADLPVVISPFVAPTSALEFTIVDAAHSDCSGSGVLPAYNCANPCNNLIDSVAYYLTDCNDAGNYTIVLDQLFPNPPNLSFLFNVSVDGVQVGSYSSASLPIDVGVYPGNGEPHEVAIYTQNTDACAYVFTTQPVFCDSDCPLESVSLVADARCDGTDFYRAELRVEGASAGDLLTITSAITNFSMTAVYNGDFVVVEMPDTGQFFDELTVCLPLSSTNALCCVEVAFDYSCPPCEITGLTIDPLPCNIDTSFSFVLNFNAQGQFSDTFSLQLSNGFEQSFLYADLPVTLGPIPGLGEQLNYWLTNESGDCGRSGTFLTPDCIDGCVLGQATTTIAAAGCNDDGTYNIPISIENAQFGDLLLVESAVTGHIDTLAYGVLNAPLLQISGWPAPPNGQETLTICFFDQPDCCTTLTFSVPCDTDCDFTATVTLLPCEANGLLRFSLTTSSNDPNLPWVMANINGQYFGRFAMNTTVEIGQIINDGSFGVLDVVVEAWAGPSSGPICSVTVPVDVSGCVSNCEIPGLEAEPLGCTQFGAYEVLLSFATDSLVGRNLDIYVNGDQIATNAAPVDWPVEVFPYNPGQSQDVITICYTDDPDCCESIAVDPLPCNCPGFGDVTIAPNNCRDDGTFTATLNIGTPAPAVGTVFIVESANYIAEFTFADLPVEIGPFPGTGAPQTVHVYIPGTDCQETATFITPNCGNGGCIFTSVIAEPYSCDGGQFLIDVAVQVNNPGTSGYFIFADGQINGPYSYNEPFVTLGPFDGDAVTVYDLLILDIEDPSCFGYAEVGPIDCGMVCDITNLLVQPLGCNDDGTYNIFLNFEVDNPGNDFFEVYGRNGNLIGYYSLDERPIVIEGLSPSASGEGYLRVCINDRPNCCEVIEFPEPDCVDVCRISDVQAEFAYCDDAGNFYVRLSFNFDNVSSGGFRVFGNGQDYGTYSYTMPFPVVVGPIAPTGALVYELIVADLNHPDCRGFTTFGAFDCNNDPQVCITFDEFETAVNDTINLAFGNPRDSIYDEEGVIFNAVAVPLGNNTNFFDWVVGSANAPCGLVGSGGNLYVNGGVEMDFSQFPSVPTTVTFDFTFCNNSTVIPQIVIGVNGELYSGPINDLPGDLPGGITIEFIPLANSLSQGQIILHGPIEQLLIGGQRIFIDNLCFNQPPPQLDDCISFDVYDGFPTDTLADFGQPQDMLYEEDGVIVTARRIEWNGGANFFTGVYDFDESGCGVMDDDDAALHFGGALRFNFTGLLNLPESVSFDLAFCPGQEQNILLLINGESYRGAISALPDMLSNVAITAMISTPNGHIWRVELTGTVEAFEIGGSGLAIDDVCFNTAPQEEEVWPGDANADNIAHHIDLLNIGLAYGFQGTPRLVDGANWTGVAAASWPQEFANGVNYKHADCNGDGVVDANDRQVLAQNYGLTHGPLGAVPSLPGTDIDPPAYIDFPGLIPVGTSFNIPIIVGSQNLPIQDVYGIAFTVVFDPQVFDPGALEIAYPVSWFGEPGINTLSIDRTYAAEGRIEVALTRTDQNNVSGYGPVAYLIGIIDDIAGFRPDTEVSIENVVAISVDEVLIPVQGRTVKFELQYKEEEPPAEAKGVFTVFPNPTTDWVTVTSKYGYQPEQLTLLTLDGKELQVPQEENRRVSLQGLPAGTYILSIRTGDTRVHKLIVKD